MKSNMHRFCQNIAELARIISILSMLGVLLHPVLPWATASSKLPSGICVLTQYQCDTKTEQNWLLFQSSTGIQNVISNFISVAQCSRNGNSNSNVYVLLAVTEKSGDLFFYAKLSFHDDLSIYKNFNSSKISEVFPDIHDDHNLIIQSDTFAYIDYSKTSPKYWLRYNQSENKIIMIAYFGDSDIFICDFVVHPR